MDTGLFYLDEVNPGLIWKKMKRRIVWILLTAIIFFGIGAAGREMDKSEYYTSQTAFSVHSDSKLEYSDFEDAKDYAKAYATVLQGKTMSETVESVIDAKSKLISIRAAQQSGTNMIEVIVTAKDADTAKSAVEAIISHYEEVLEGMNLEGTLHVVQNATQPKRVASEPGWTKAIVLSVLGVCASAGVIVGWEVFRPTIKTRAGAKRRLAGECIGVARKAAEAESRYTDDIYGIANKIEQRMCEISGKSLLVTSTEPKEGVSTVVMNLANVLQEKGRRVEVISGEACSSDSALLGEVKSRADYVIIDAIAMAKSVDTEALAYEADASVLVVSQDRAKWSRIQNAVWKLTESTGKYLGFVLNDWATMNEREWGPVEDEVILDFASMLTDVRDCIRKYWRTMLILVLVAVTVGYTFSKPNVEPKYNAEMTFAVSTKKHWYMDVYEEYTYNVSEENTMKPILAGVMNLNVYIQMIRDGLEIEALDGTIAVYAVSESSQFQLYVAGSSSAEAALSLLEEAYEQLPNVLGLAIGDVKLTMVEAPSSSQAKISMPKVRPGIALGLIISLLCCALIVGIYVLRRLQCVHKEADLKIRLGIRSYGEVASGKEDDVRSVALRLEKELSEQGRKVVLVDGSVSEKVSASVAATLSKVLAKKKHKVLLIDCNLADPGMGGCSVTENRDRLSEALLGRTEWRACLTGQDDLGIDYLGNTNTTTDYSRWISGDSFKVIVEEAKMEYDVVILSTPGSKNVSGVKVAANAADGIVYLVDKTAISAKTIRSSLQSIAEGGTPVMGGVFVR